ncbi:hypothetical protein NEPAR06_1500 [Nematocida parisii]|uniref:Chromatin modification-related protein EAF6 n=1 Tax=Nematocida parisii (strain ERTm3) TaxID=935791 RepID=I3EH98_NEMP3|nr:uncharacterized protein NEPG_00369 [Nematocida parisii ERTm1]EIJ88595.1 hypothetical protein NEQG_01285 [Nematocida parisii ERTm3]KAI5130656.1 hypothetical protein NEPAR03_2149 [Nematocida parisii]KAI5165015.1 hypothetical protein NEIRO02_0012 [Nematocida sp. AWRm79]KAI5182318.1 hypothetical protein NEIRO03_0002 [Nematocida sp. AWRm78]OAG30643.1 hypothetical protein NEIG_00155 [Nematocida sp. ERTm5]|eukprot:XP_013058201.1 hypothetical protein NEPG_00369 [Nematocida parisii ERTm1]
MSLESLSSQTTDDLHRKLEVYISKKKKLEMELHSIEKKIYAYEGLLLDENGPRGIFRKQDGYTFRKERKVGINDCDRPFSMDLPE